MIKTKNKGNNDILKDAIAQAKVLKEVAIENAKTILMESFEPKMNSILSSKLQKEMEGDEDEETVVDNEEEMTEEEDLELEPSEDETELEETEDPGQDDPNQTSDDQDVTPDLTEEDELPVEDDEEDLEFENVLRELDDEMSDEEQLEPSEDEMTEEEDLDSAPVEDELEAEPSEDEVTEEEDLDAVPSEDDEEINLEELLGDDETEDEMTEEENLDVVPSEDEELQSQLESLRKENLNLKKNLTESKKAIKILSEEVNDINLLNHKLVNTVKLFRAFNLSNESKMKIVETFDRARSVREVKLVFATLYESYKNSGAKKRPANVKTLSEVKNTGASKTVIAGEHFSKSTILSEGKDLTSRFMKLANIKEN